MISRSQQSANSANAKKSTGPVTEAGKRRTRLNAYRHGLTGQVHILTAEEREAFDNHCTSIRDALAPVGALELDLAQSIAEDRWRLKRARALETGIFALGQSDQPATGDPEQLRAGAALSQARTWLAEGRNLELLSLYEQRIHRDLEKTMTGLRTLQAERKAARQEALEEAQLLAQLAYLKAKEYDPAADFPSQAVENGSDFSSASIHRRILRDRCLKEARYYAGTGWDPQKPYRHSNFPVPPPSDAPLAGSVNPDAPTPTATVP